MWDLIDWFNNYDYNLSLYMQSIEYPYYYFNKVELNYLIFISYCSTYSITYIK